MDDMVWVRIRSWHVVANRGLGFVVTMCGRRADEAPLVTTANLPMSQKSCETCARIVLHRQETA